MSTAQPSSRSREHAPSSLSPADTCPILSRSVVDCGWGRLIFAHTFSGHEALIAELRREREGERDIAFYPRDPHVTLSMAPQDLFLDPSHTFRLMLRDYRPNGDKENGFLIRPAKPGKDRAGINRIYAARHMVPLREGFLAANRDNPVLFTLVAENSSCGEIVGVATGVDHRLAFEDPAQGASLWALAVDPQSAAPGVGEALVRRILEIFKKRGRAFLDLSVMHDNTQAIALYQKLGFQQIPTFTLKRKNPINEKLFIAPPPLEKLNVYARIIIDEARRRGIAVEIVDARAGLFCLTFGGRSLLCRESLSQLTSATTMSICDDKELTRRILVQHGIRVPRQRVAGTPTENAAFLKICQRLVVKPARGEQGQGVSVDLTSPMEVEKAVEKARRQGGRVLLEEYVTGEDLRLVVIDHQVVAAAIRRPAQVQGDGRRTIRQLIEKQSRRRAAATQGESRIPLDGETKRCVALAGYEMDAILRDGVVLMVRKTANLHTGGTIHDVTDRVHPAILEAGVQATRALDIPVVGLDFIVPDINRPEYHFIEANERPGLANHEPQPTAQRFVDLLFPQSTTDNDPGRNPTS